MNKLSGKILQKESRRGLKDLIVLLYDIDVVLSGTTNLTNNLPSNSALPPQLREQFPTEGHPMLIQAGELIMRLYAADDGNEDNLWARTTPAGGRLGSTITTADGGFSIAFDDSAFQQVDQEQRPEALLMILAPDQSLDTTLADGSPSTFIGTPEYQRILHISFLPLRNMAREESVIIKIAQEQLNRFDLNTSIEQSSGPEQINAQIALTEEFNDGVVSVFRNRARQKVSLQQQRADSAQRFVKNLSALPKSFRRSPYFFDSRETNSDRLRNIQIRVSRDGIDNISLQTSDSAGRTPQAYLSLEQDWLEKLMPGRDTGEILEAIAAGSSVELEVDYGAFCSMLATKNGGTELTRKTESRDQREIRDRVIARLKALRNPEPISDDEVITEGEDIPASGATDELSMEDRIKAIVLKQVSDLTATDSEPAADESSSEQKKRISASLEELTPPVGPADATAYHDFTSLQMAFPNIWTEAFDGNVEDIVRQLKITYDDAYEAYREGSGDVLNRLGDFNEEEIYDLKEYTQLLGELSGDIAAFEGSAMPQAVRELLTSVNNQQPENSGSATGSFKDIDGLLGKILSGLPTFAGSGGENASSSIRFVDRNNEQWNKLSMQQQAELIQLAEEFASLPDFPERSLASGDLGEKAFLARQFEKENLKAEDIESMTQLLKEVNDNAARDNNSSLPDRKQEIRARAQTIIASPEGKNTRAQRLMAELAERLKAPHSFRIFAENSYNFGIMTTHRQKWIPGDYQAGDLVSTITLAPGEKRQYVKKEVLKKSRSRKEDEKNASTINDERTYSSKATQDIIDKVSTNTNFAQSISASTSGQLGVFSINGQSSTEFGRDQSIESERRKQSIREATRKAAQEYKNERSIEISTEHSSEFESTSTSEINNPNNEITVTYLFYELERQYQVSEQIHKVSPVIMVAQQVPAPHEIDEDWLMTHEWVLRRVILDRSFLEALDYISEGLVSDEVSLQVIRENYETQKTLVEEISQSVSALSEMQETLRNSLIQTSEQEQLAEVFSKRARKKRRRRIARRIFDPINVSKRIARGDSNLTFGEHEDPAVLEARREALETRLEYLDTNLETARSDLNTANSALNEAMQELSTALREMFTRRNLVAQLKLHIKQNILYYMQAIWTHEYSHQRYMRLYNLPIDIPMPGRRPSRSGSPTTSITLRPIPEHIREGIYRATHSFSGLSGLVGATFEWPGTEAGRAQYHTVSKRLHEIADVDNLLGFKGNYMIFPLKTCTYITNYMMQDYVDEYLGVRSPDPLSDLSTDELLEYAEQIWHHEDTTEAQQNALEQLIVERLNSPRLKDERIVVPTGQLFIEALKGNHTLLEHFKLKHRELDVQKVQEEVRSAKLENLRKAYRMVREEGALLNDPEVDKTISVEGNADISVTE